MSRLFPLLNRCVLALLVILAVVFGWAWFELWQHTKADAEFARRVFTPAVSPLAQPPADTPDAGADRVAPFVPRHPVPLASLQESIDRMEVRFRFARIRDNAFLGMLGTVFCWSMVALIQASARRREWESAERPALPNAGHLVGELVQRGQSFVAKAGNRAIDAAVEVDGRRALVIFRNFRFIAAFTGNPLRTAIEIPISDLIAASLTYDKGRAFLHVRTTKGRVTVTDKVRPFQTLAELLMDAVELNRTAPEQYRATRAREPVVRTPWYGWLIVVAAFLIVIAVFWSVLN